MVQDTNEDEDGAQKGCGAKFNNWWKEFKLQIWNGEKKEFIGRTATSWACILLFYVAFFAFTGGYFAVCFSIFMRTIDDRVPTYQGYYSILKFNPGMNYVSKLPKSSFLVKFNSSMDDSFMDNYVTPLEREIERYANATNLKMCNGDTSSTFDEACRFNVSTLGKECSSKNTFGYPDGKPCLLLKINNVYGWNPAEDVFKPDDVGCHGNDDNSNECKFFKISQKFKSSVDLQHIPVSCSGEDNVDDDNLIEVKFSPPSGIPLNFYPYYNQKDFLPPLIAAQFMLKRGVSVSIICKFWTRNIKHDDADRQGSLNVHLMVDGNSDHFNVSNVSTESPKESSSSKYESSTVFFTETLSAQATKDVTSGPEDTSLSFKIDETTATVNTHSSSF